MVYVFCLILLGAIGFQFALIFGAPWGRLTQGGQIDGALPRAGRIAAAVSVIILGAIALAVLSTEGYWPHWPRWTIWPATGMIGITTVLNWITPSVAERRLWAPVMTLALILIVAITWSA